MAWWLWLLIGWAVLATVVGLWLGAAAAMARRREREARARQYGEVTQDVRRAS